jgi:hypothetical protein
LNAVSCRRGERKQSKDPKIEGTRRPEWRGNGRDSTMVVERVVWRWLEVRFAIRRGGFEQLSCCSLKNRGEKAE